MLRQLRSKNMKNWILAGLLVIVIPAFVSFYGWQDSDVRAQSGPAVVVKFSPLDKIEVPQGELQMAQRRLENRLGSYLEHTGLGKDDGLVRHISMDSRAAVDEAINLAILRHYATEKKLAVSLAEVAETMKQMVPAQFRGQFEMNLQQQGMTLETYAAQLQEALLIQKVRETLGAQVRVTDFEAWLEFLQKRERMVVDYVRLDISEFTAKVETTEEQLKAYFEKNKEKFKVPNQVQYAFAMVTKDDLKTSVTVTDDDITSYYQQRQEEYRLPRQAHVRQIFLKRPTAQDAATSAPDELTSLTEIVRNRAADIYQRAAKGEDFAKLADQYTQETAFPPRDRNTSDTDLLTTAGGNLGFISETIARASYTDTWTSTVFSMKPGSIQPPIETSRGFYVVKLEALREGLMQPLEKVKDIIRERMMDEQVEPLFAQMGDRLKQEMEAQTTLEAVAKATSMTVELTPKVDKNARAIPKIGPLNEFVEAVMDLQKGTHSKEVLTDKYKHLIIEVREEFPSHIPTYEAAREKVSIAFKEEKALELARNTAETIKSKAKDAATFSTAVVDAGLTTTRSHPFIRLESDAVVGPVDNFADISKATAKGEIVMSQMGDKKRPTGFVVWHMIDKIAPPQADFRKELATLTADLSEEKKEIVLNEFVARRRQELKNNIEVNPLFR